MSRKVLVVDDDRKTVALVKLYLEREGCTVFYAYDGTAALNVARREKPEVIVLDLMLPGIDGGKICTTLRAESDVAILMLTARATLEDRIAGLDLGADDYLVKPFSPRELVARVKAVMRRLPSEALFRGPEEIIREDVHINTRTREARVDGQLINLTPVEFRLLTVLAGEPGRVFTREQLVTKIFGHDYDGLDRAIDVHMMRLRRKVEPDPSDSRYLKTVYGVGYTFHDTETP
ncbi:MAG: DNA-binding response regulator [Spirochaetaceae bacterium]|nr:MAG: DNA-binding response regulator [Spirochaetaceae bacterium]